MPGVAVSAFRRTSDLMEDTGMTDHSEAWPPLPYEAWKDTLETLHLWTQVVGKVRLTQSPWLNHSWHVTLYVTSRGLSTSPISHGTRTFEIEFDFLTHQLVIVTGEGKSARIPLEPQSVATFYARLMEGLNGLGLHVKIHAKPNEIPTIHFGLPQRNVCHEVGARPQNRPAVAADQLALESLDVGRAAHITHFDGRIVQRFPLPPSRFPH